MYRLHKFQGRRVGLALSGGSVRGIAHIGVLKALSEYGIRPTAIAGTSVGSLVGAGVAAGMSWQDLAAMAQTIFWPSLLHGRTLERFCSKYLPANFGDLQLPFAAVATTLPHKKPVTLTNGRLASAINASCAVRARFPVYREGAKLKDGGISCVLPSLACRELGADFIIASDVWEVSALLRGVGLRHTHPRAFRAYPRHFIHAVDQSDVLIQTDIPVAGYWPGRTSVDRLIAAGESAAHKALAQVQ
ncbi:MAG TPA: patatin-like phospholipase family protein [Candidatus Angelobacter sp.]